jgi:hypothetical protein
MNETLLTAFQRDAESGIRALLEGRGKAVLDREIYEGVVPFYSPEMQRYVKLLVEGLEVWLFDNEASFSGPAGSGEFERADYASEAELMEALLEDLASRV